MSVLLGATVEEASSALSAEGALRVGPLETRLRDPRRAVRAQGLAAVGQEIAFAIAELALR